MILIADAAAAHPVNPGDLVVIALILAGAWIGSLALWPFTKCGKCKGSGENPGSNPRRWGHCRRCGGSRKRLRFGARLVRRDLR